MSEKEKRTAADSLAIGDDFSHAEQCAKHLMKSSNYDNTEKRALWQSGLISFRRALRNGQTMFPGTGGGLEKPFDAKNIHSHIPVGLRDSYDELVVLADKSVAHRTVGVGGRRIEFKLEEGKMLGHFALPSSQQIDSLMKISYVLKMLALTAAAMAMESLRANG